MKIVIDEDLPRSLGTAQQKIGYEVFDIRDHGLRGKSDEDIFRFSQEREAVLFSGDLGFANIFKFPLGSHAGIAVLRFPNEMQTEAMNAIVIELIGKLSQEDIFGNLVIFSPSGLRLKRRY